MNIIKSPTVTSFLATPLVTVVPESKVFNGSAAGDDCTVKVGSKNYNGKILAVGMHNNTKPQANIVIT